MDFQVFVLRLWREASSGTWRGQIVHLPVQATTAFASWDQALAFVARYGPTAGSDHSHSNDWMLPADTGG